MKTFGRLIRRYLLAAAGIVLLLVMLVIAFIGRLVWQESSRGPQWEYAMGNIAESMVQTDEGLAFGPEHAPEEWMDGYVWAMVLDDDGDVIWNYALPQELDHRYTASDVAKFSRWYLDGYPVFCWAAEHGLFVVGVEKDRIVRYNAYSSPEIVRGLVGSVVPILLSLLGLIVLICFLLSWQGAKELLALARRDNARTQWIAGVSHDVRTPLALILGWAEQLEQDTALPEHTRQKAGGIRTQSEKLRTLIDDLNLTSKLQYGAQPLRKEELTAGPLMRQLVARFCESPLAERCDLSLTQSLEAEQAKLSVDRALLERLLENLLGNSVRHNTLPVQIRVETARVGRSFILTVTDNGRGYPPEVLEALQAAEPAEDAPHILGLHVVEQIAAAHGGKAVFSQNTPNGAKAVVTLPLG